MGLRRFFISLMLLVITAAVANAYTVIMRDGRTVEIPNEFTVSNSTLTYQVGSGMQITLQLNSIDIAATERANREAPGSLLKRANAPKAAVEPVPQTRRGTAARSITNADLEKHRRARVESEKEYENLRRDLGLPSMEERRQEAAAITERTIEHVRNLRAQEEALWRSRADALRAEMAARQAQFEFSRQRAADIPFAYSVGGFPEFFPFDGVGFGITGGRFHGLRRFPSSPFDGFLATPITRFPTFPFDPVFRGHRGGRLVFGAPGVRFNPRPSHGRRGSHR